MKISLSIKISVFALCVTAAGMLLVAGFTCFRASNLLLVMSHKMSHAGLVEKTGLFRENLDAVLQDLLFLPEAGPVKKQLRSSGTPEKFWTERLEGLFSILMKRQPAYRTMGLVSFAEKTAGGICVSQSESKSSSFTIHECSVPGERIEQVRHVFQNTVRKETIDPEKDRRRESGPFRQGDLLSIAVLAIDGDPDITVAIGFG